MTHLTSDELIDAVEGALGSARHAHLEACPACRREVDHLTATLRDARAVAIPEPSPLFWQHFSNRVRTAMAGEPSAAPWPLWLRWPVLTPLAALGLLVVALITAVPQRRPVVLPVAANDVTPTPGEQEAENADDSAWAFIVESIGPLDVETAQEAGIAASPGEAERVALHLSDAEQAELVRLLQQELTRSGS